MVDDPWTFRDGWASLVSGEIIYISPRGVPKYCRNSRRRRRADYAEQCRAAAATFMAHSLSATVPIPSYSVRR